MAEAFGVAAGAAGFISLGIEISKGVDTLRQLAKDVVNAPDVLVSLTEKLQFLVLLLHRVDDKKGDPIMTLPQKSCAGVVSGLLKLKQRYATVMNESKHLGRPHRLDFRHWRGDVEDLQRRIQEAIIQLSLVCSLKTYTSVQELAIVRQVHNVDSATMTVEQTSEIQSSSTRVTTLPLTRRRPRARDVREACACSCHRTSLIRSRFWSFEFTPPAAIFYQSCRRNCCDASRYGARVQVALTRLGIRWSAIVQFQIDISPSKFAFRPAFYVLQTVPYTSPGFVILAELKSQSIDIDVTSQKLLQLSHDDPTIKHHVNPAGENYLEFFVTNLDSLYLGEAVRMVKFLSEQVGIKVTDARILPTLKFVYRDENQRIRVESILLHLLRHAGLQIEASPQTNSEPIELAQFRSPSDYWRWSACSALMVAELRAICDIDPDLGAMTPLHEAVVYGHALNVKSGDIVDDLDARNIWGQTALHLAVILKTDNVKTLVELGSDPEATDMWGHTPLTHSGLSGNWDAVSILTNAGGTKSKSNSGKENVDIGSLAFSIASGDASRVVAQAFSAIEKAYGQATLREIARKTVLAVLLFRNDHIWAEMGIPSLRWDDLASVFEKTDGVNFLSDGRTLLHHGSLRPFLELVSSRGFCLWGCSDDHGYSILHAAVLRMWTTLKLTLSWVNKKQARDGSLLNLTRLLLKPGIPLKLDETKCICLCSREGYVPRMEQHDCSASKHFSMIEYLANVETMRGLEVAKDVLLSMIRQYIFDELQIPHVCELRSRSTPPRNRPIDADQSPALEERMDAYARYEYGELGSEWIGCAFNEYKACDMDLLSGSKLELTVNTAEDRMETKFVYGVYSDEEMIAEVTNICAVYVAAIQLEFQQPGDWLLEPSRARELHTRRLSWTVQYMKKFNIGKDRMFDAWIGGWIFANDEAKTHIELFNEHADGSHQERNGSDLDSLDGYHTAEED